MAALRNVFRPLITTRTATSSIPRTRLAFTTPTLRTFSTTSPNMVKIVAVLYDGGKHAAEEPRLLGTTENKLGLEKWAKDNGHELVVTSDKDGPNSVAYKEMADADVMITQPFWPFYIKDEADFDNAKKLKICITAGVGSDHVNVPLAAKRGVDIYEVTGSNVVSVAEHVVMTILVLIKNYNVGHRQAVVDKTWDIAGVARDAFDLEGKTVGTIGAGRIGFRVLQRLKPFDCAAYYYYDYAALPDAAAKEVGAQRITDLKEFLGKCDVVTVNAPLHDGTRGMINEETISYMKDGAWLINTARGAICDEHAVAKAVNSGKLRGYGGDVWFPQPAPKDHPWRTMEGPNGRGNAMVPHMSGTVIDAQARYAAGAKDILERWLAKKQQDKPNIIVEGGEVVSPAYGEKK